ncbi:MAG: hypothetical protein ACJZ63_06170 [Candidatus Poseidoniaceae archaeon]|tara:strand:- start:65 stop:505 length:441 start_codon:yes stop_codon:yes gene_type:complete
MANAGFNVIRCPACMTCHGRRGVSASCPHCGQRLGEHGIVVKSVNSAEALRIEVALANTPEELRDTLRKRMVSKTPLTDFHDEVPSRTMGKWVQDSKNDEGFITVQSVQLILYKNHSNLDANEVIEQAEVQGMLVRVDKARWMLLE